MTIRVSACASLAAIAAIVGAAGAWAATPTQLLKRYAPVVVLHPDERFGPVPVDGFVADSDLLRRASNSTWQPTGTQLASAGRDTRLDQRSCRASDGPAALDCYRSAQEQHAATPTAYGAVFRTGSRIALQYWLFYPANVLTLQDDAGQFWQSHEGDWEAVTVLLDSRERPLFVGLSQHCAGVRRDWSRVPRRGTRPVVYVAAGSHANYFTPGRHALDRRCWPPEALAVYDAYKVALFDETAAGKRVAPSVARLTSTTPSWASFAGTWGEDQYVKFPGVDSLRFGAGPVGPVLHALWRRPVTTVLGWPSQR